MSRGEPLIRQWSLLKAMQANRFGLSAEELALRVEYSKRQVLRDLRVLQEVGFPVHFEQRDYGKRYWKLSPHFLESDKMIFSLTEMISIYLGRKLLAPLSGTQFGEGLDSLLEKIKASLSSPVLRHFNQLNETLLVKNHILNDYSAHDKKIRLLSKAIEECTAVDLKYHSLSQGSPYDTLYHPYGMVFFDGDLYCIGWMKKYGEVRTLKISRILSAQMTQERFRCPGNFSLKTHTQNTFGIFSTPKDAQKIQVRMDGWAAQVVRECQRHPSQKIIRDSGDSLVVEFELGDMTELKRWLLGFGANACVLMPQELADGIQSEARNMTALYGCKPKKTVKR